MKQSPSPKPTGFRHYSLRNLLFRFLYKKRIQPIFQMHGLNYVMYSVINFNRIDYISWNTMIQCYEYRGNRYGTYNEVMDLFLCV